MSTPHSYDHKAVEPAWQRIWGELLLDSPDTATAKKPYYNLMMFPYPSAEGLHVGNMYAFTGSDIHGRFMRMQGFDVLEPIGLDGFGIHSENYALKIGRHPKEHAAITEKRFYEQLQKIGAMFDWTRTLETYDPSYYRFTQWLFTALFKRGLAYRGTAAVNYCPSCKTVLADEQVVVKTIDGVSNNVCERCGNIVEKRLLKQWFFRITAYAEKLLENIPELKWSDVVKTAQTNWIGKKEGISIVYPLVNGNNDEVGNVTVFTTRPDTNFGATFVVIAPEHPLITSLHEATYGISVSIQKEITEYVKKTAGKSQQEREVEGRKKTGVFTGLYCINPLNGTKMPLYIADFVLMNFGTGAVVGVPGHDIRDFEFAQALGVPIIRVVVGADGDRSPITRSEQVQEDDGVMINSGFLDGMHITNAIGAMMDHIEKNGWGTRTATYHLRDWTISRQRYWGPPIPMVYCDACAKKGESWFTTSEGKQSSSEVKMAPDFLVSMAGWYPVSEGSLPVELPTIDDYKPGDDGIAPLAKHKEFYETVCPGCGASATRETDVSDTFLDSAWYFLRYPCIAHAPHALQHAVSQDPTHGDDPVTPSIIKKWLPVNMYTGGAEHSVLHLLYSRFITMVLHDIGLIDFDEPFTNFYAHGLVIKDGAKMSKSKGNVVNPDEYISKYGADALRMYLMFMGPLSDGGDFRDSAMEGMYRWVGRIWRLVMMTAKEDRARTDEEICSKLHKTIAKVTDDMHKRRYNTALSSLMEYTNALQDSGVPMARGEAEAFVKMLAPFAPHLAEELWQWLCGREALTQKNDSVHFQSYPVMNPDAIRNSSIQFVVQVNGKLRDTIEVTVEQAHDETYMNTLVQARPNVMKHLTGVPKKTIFVKGKLINIVC